MEISLVVRIIQILLCGAFILILYGIFKFIKRQILCPSCQSPISRKDIKKQVNYYSFNMLAKIECPHCKVELINNERKLLNGGWFFLVFCMALLVWMIFTPLPKMGESPTIGFVLIIFGALYATLFCSYWFLNELTNFQVNN